MSSYTRGYYYEKRAARALRDDGYFVVESRGSHGVADLVALKVRQALMVQVKSGKARLCHREWNGLYEAAQAAGAIPVVADWPSRGRLRLVEITGPHRRRSRLWPSRAFTTDLIAGS